MPLVQVADGRFQAQGDQGAQPPDPKQVQAVRAGKELVIEPGQEPTFEIALSDAEIAEFLLERPYSLN